MATTADPLAALRDAIGVPREPTSWRTVTQEDIDAFARITNDHQWIHVDEERAKRESPFRTTIAHGNLTLTIIDVPREQFSARDALDSERIELCVDMAW